MSRSNLLSSPTHGKPGAAGTLGNTETYKEAVTILKELIRAVADQRSSSESCLANKTKMFFESKKIIEDILH